MNGTALAGVSGAWSPGDHVHPTDSTRLAKAGDTMTGALTINPATTGPALAITPSTSSPGPAISISSPTANAASITISCPWATYRLDKPVSGSNLQIVGSTNSSNRWIIVPGDGGTESGSNTGSNFAIQRCNDGGAAIDNTLSLNRANAQFTVTGAPYCPGGGAWNASSDVRIKTVLGNYASGLRELIKLRPVNYFYKGNDTAGDPSESPHRMAAITQTKYVGLVAQEAEEVMPELVKKRPGFIDGQAVTDFRDLDQTPLTFALINAVRELAARVVALETICGIS
jgi:hypothetical protein